MSTAYGLEITPRNPAVPLKGTEEGVGSPLTTQAHPADSLLGRPVDQEVGSDTAPQTGNAVMGWISGPNLPVERWNMAMQGTSGEGGGQAPHGPPGAGPR